MIDVELYGGRRAYLAHLWSRALYECGSYRAARRINWGTIARLVFVCKGNICRSPYAAERARTLGVRAVSFGLDATDGACADEAASRIALLRGIDLSAHRSLRLRASLIEKDDLVVAFEPWHLRRLLRQDMADPAGITLIGLWAQPVLPRIQDPYGRRDRYFYRCFSTIDLRIHELLKHMSTHHAPANVSGIPNESVLTSLR